MLNKEHPQRTNGALFHVCCALIWLMFTYSTIIQYKYTTISNAMLILGALILGCFLLLSNGQELSITSLFSAECGWMLTYMAYMLVFGTIFSSKQDYHLSQWLTAFEYLFIMLVMVNLIGRTGTNTFQALLLFTSIPLGIILLTQPVLYTTGRYSISEDLNPNYIGMCFSAGIWALLYFQQKSRIPLLALFPTVAFFVYCILQTGSRKALIAAGIELIMWLLFCFYPHIRNDAAWKRVLSLLLCTVLSYYALRLFITEYSTSSIAQRMSNLQAEASEGERSELYQIGWRLFKSNPFFGSGYSGFISIRGEHSHATFIEIPVSGGIFGSLVYFAAYIVSIRNCWQIYVVCRRDASLQTELVEIKMILVLWAVMLFYCTCIIHPHQFLSYLSFGIIFGKTVYLKCVISQKQLTGKQSEMRNRNFNGKSKYIKA